MGGERVKKRGFPVSCAQSTCKVLLQTNGTDGKLTLKGVPFRVSTNHMSRTPNGEPQQTHEKVWCSEIYFIYPVRRIRWIQRYDYFSNASKIGEDFARELAKAWPSRMDTRREYSPLFCRLISDVKIN